MENPSTEKKATEWANIFDELGSDLKDMHDLEEKRKKDVYFYLWAIGTTLKVLNFLFLIFFAISLFYIFIQKSEKNLDVSFLEPICQVFLWASSNKITGCTWVTYLITDTQQNLSNLKNTQYKQIQDILPDVYSVDNFIYSREVSFLLWKTEDRVRPLKMMAAFDKMKTTFDPNEKSKIKCGDTSIDLDGYFNIECQAFSSDWDTKIIWFDGEKVSANVEGTSISTANSFINYIEKSSKEFTIIDRQRVFNYENVTEGSYTRKTIFTLKLKYNNSNN